MPGRGGAGRRLTIVSDDGVPSRFLRTVGLADRLDVLSELPEQGAPNGAA
jgi:hypothetical protein